MGKTYAYNSIIIGFLVGLLVWAKSQKIALGIIVFIAVSVVGFIIIRFLEKALSKGVNAAADAASKAYENHRQKKNGEEK
ncbi:MAG: hypothetical protein J5586_05660 [Clostridia bacterium]|nr:hypothetical protein [Clostridia bacterium]